MAEATNVAEITSTQAKAAILNSHKGTRATYTQVEIDALDPATFGVGSLQRDDGVEFWSDGVTIAATTVNTTTPITVVSATNVTPLIQLTNAGPAKIDLINSTKTVTATNAQSWSLNSNGTFRITALGATGTALKLDAGGNLTVVGALTSGSDANNKENIEPINGQDILNRLASLPISTWNYKNDGPSIRHLGPMAQDFYAKFNLGATDKGIASLDADGVALISIQQLNENLIEQSKTIANLQTRLAALERPS